MVRTRLCGPAPQLPLFCCVSSRPPSHTSSTSPLVELVEVPRLQLWPERLGDLGFGLEHRIWALSVVTCAVFVARPCQHVAGCSHSSCSPPWVPVPCPVWELGLWPQHKGRVGVESRFVSQLQLDSVTRAGQLPGLEGRFRWEDPCFGRGWQGRCRAVWSTCCSSRLVGLCGNHSFCFSLQNGTGLFAPVVRRGWLSGS